MKTIGLLGGMSWESTAVYYELLNKGIHDRLGASHSAKIILYSVDFEEMVQYKLQDDWQKPGKLLAECARSLQDAGADMIVICTNTMHKLIDTIQANISIPVLHIAKATAIAMQKEKVKKAILLGTRFTMKEDFIKDVISSYGIEVITPNPEQMKHIDDIIYHELVVGDIKEESKQTYIKIIDQICEDQEDIDALILGCTEIGLLIEQKDTKLKLFDTLPLHVEAAIEESLKIPE